MLTVFLGLDKLHAGLFISGFQATRRAVLESSQSQRKVYEINHTQKLTNFRRHVSGAAFITRPPNPGIPQVYVWHKQLITF
jgi:hypothetical protein